MAGERKTNSRAASHTNREHQEQTRESYSGGRGWHGDPAGHAAAGRKGGQKIASNREHMAEIGRRGGEAVSRDRRHMAEIGRKGGQARSENSTEKAKSTEKRSGKRSGKS